jgi:hypothetical protein
MKFTASLGAMASVCLALVSCSAPGAQSARSVPVAGTPHSTSSLPIPAQISSAVPPPPPSMNRPASPPTGGRRIREDTPHPAFFSGETAVGGGVYYLAFANSNVFGYYSYDSGGNYIYHYDLGWEYYQDANDSNHGIYLYDFATDHWWYTSPQYPFPYLYDFTLGATLYYYPDTTRTGHYTENPRYFYDFGTSEIIELPDVGPTPAPTPTPGPPPPGHPPKF